MSAIPIELYGVPGLLIVMGVIAMIEQSFPVVSRYAGLLAILVATLVGTLVLYLAGVMPIERDVLEALAWGLATVAVHASVVKPMKGDQPPTPPAAS